MRRGLLLASVLVGASVAPAFGAIPVVQSFQVKTMTGDDTARVAKPASVAAGELVLLLVATANDQAGPCLTPPADFNEIYDFGGVTPDTRVWAALKVAGSSEPDSYFVANTCGSAAFIMWSLRITGQAKTNILNATGASSSTGSAQTIAVTGVTTTADSCLVFYFASFDGGDGDPFTVSGTGFSETSENVTGTSTTTDVGAAFGSRTLASAGASGSATVDATGTVADGWQGGQFAIRGSLPTDSDTSWTYTGASDIDMAYLNSSSTTLNYGARAAGLGCLTSRKHILRANGFSVPSGFTVDSGMLTVLADANLDCHQGANDSSLYALHELLRQWGEGNNDGTAADAGEVSYDSSQTGTVAWATGGAENATDRASAFLTDTVIGILNDGNAVRFTIPGSVVASWVSANYGLIIQLIGTSAGCAGAGFSIGTDDGSFSPTFEFWGSVTGGAPEATGRRHKLLGSAP